MKSKDPSQQYRRPFIAELSKANVRRIKGTASAMIMIDAIVVLTFCIVKKEELRSFSDNMYLIFCALLFAVMLCYLIYFSVIGKNPEKNAGLIHVGAVSFAVLFLFGSAALSLLDRFQFGQMAIYTGGIMLSVLLFYIPPRILIPLCLLVHTLFITGLFVVQDSPELRFTNILVSTAVLILSLVTSWNVYNGRLEYFRRRAQIESKNRELTKLNQELQEANLELEKRSATDALTGLNNRRMFEEVISKEWERCKRYSITLSVIMMDVDHFKCFNDHYGHQIGDHCLHQIGMLLTKTVRFASDIAARYGGEEFIIALPYTDSEKAAALAERIRSEVERLKIDHEASHVADHVTVSLGVSTTIPGEHNSPDELIYAADMALYEAKDKNRNCVIAVEV